MTRASMQQALAVVKRRLHALGVTSPSAVLRGSNEISVQLDERHKPTRVAAVIGRQGVFDIYDFEGDLASISMKSGAAAPFPSLDALRAAERSRPPVVSGAIVKGSAEAGGGWYLFRTAPDLGPSDLLRREISADPDPNTGQPEVVLAFTHQGSAAFQRITKAEYVRGRRLAGLHGSAARLNQQYAQHNAIVLDGVIEETPYIDYTDPSLSLGIAGGSVILVEPTRRAASDLAIVLRSGPLPFPLTRVRSRRGE